MNASPATPLAATALLTEIITLLCQTIAMRVGLGGLTRPAVAYIVARLGGIGRRFRELAARLAAGKIPRNRAGKQPRRRPVWDTDLLGLEPPRGWRRYKAKWARIAREAAGLEPPVWRALRQRRGWLLTLAPQIANFRESAASCRARLAALLAAPEMRDLLRASPAVGESLRPLCWMLGLDVFVLSAARPAVFSGAAAAPGAAEDESVARRTGLVLVHADVSVPPAPRPRGFAPAAATIRAGAPVPRVVSRGAKAA